MNWVNIVLYKVFRRQLRGVWDNRVSVSHAYPRTGVSLAFYIISEDTHSMHKPSFYLVINHNQQP